MSCSIRSLFAPFVMLSLLCLPPLTASAASKSDQCEKDLSEIAKVIGITTDSEIQQADKSWEDLPPALDNLADKIGEAFAQINSFKKRMQSGTMNYNYLMANAAVENAVAAQTAREVEQNMQANVYQSSSGNLKTVNSSQEGSENPEIGMGPNIDANYMEIFNKKFCDPDSQNSKEDCEAKPTGKRENFIDFFLSDRPWQTIDVVDAANIAQRLFGGRIDKIMLDEDGIEPAKLVERQELVTLRNLKMSILNSMAMRRAPVSQATAEVLKTMFSILNPNGGGSVSYKEACIDHKNATAVDVYVCSHASTMGGTKGLMSESAFEKIFDFDYLMSWDFYSDLNQPGTSLGSIDKLAVVLKARQLAQDYRALRLLQMKTVMAAVNMVNSSGQPIQ